MKKEYISPKVIAREVKLDNLLVDMSNGEADPNSPVLSKRGSKFNSADFDDEEDF